MIILVAKGRGRGRRGKGRGTRGRGARGGARGAGTSNLRRSNRVKEKDRSYNAEEEVEEVEEDNKLLSNHHSHCPNNHPPNNHCPNDCPKNLSHLMLTFLVCKVTSTIL